MLLLLLLLLLSLLGLLRRGWWFLRCCGAATLSPRAFAAFLGLLAVLLGSAESFKLLVESVWLLGWRVLLWQRMERGGKPAGDLDSGLDLYLCVCECEVIVWFVAGVLCVSSIRRRELGVVANALYFEFSNSCADHCACPPGSAAHAHCWLCDLQTPSSSCRTSHWL